VAPVLPAIVVFPLTPVPERSRREEFAVVEPIVIVFAAAPEPIAIVFTPVPPVPTLIATALVPVPTFTVCVPPDEFAENKLNVCKPALCAPDRILTVAFCAVAPLLIDVTFAAPVPDPIVTVDAPAPLAIATVDVPEELPRVISPVCAAFPIVIVVPVAPDTAILFPPTSVKVAPAVELPTVTLLAVESFPIRIIPPLPTTEYVLPDAIVEVIFPALLDPTFTT